MHAPLNQNEGIGKLNVFLTTHLKQKKIAILGRRGSARILFDRMQQLPGGDQIKYYFDADAAVENEIGSRFHNLFGVASRGEVDAFIIEGSQTDIRYLVRHVKNVLGLRTDIIVGSVNFTSDQPNNPIVGCYDFDEFEKMDRPITVVSPPCAGTNRFQPTIGYLLTHFGWKFKGETPFMTNAHFISQLHKDNFSNYEFKSNTEVARVLEENTTECYYWISKMLDKFEYSDIHDHGVRLQRLLELDCSFVVLMRDPRDILNSFWHRMPLNMQNEEELNLLIDGNFFGLQSNYIYKWQSIKEWSEMYRFAVEADNAYIVRFEDLHYDSRGTLKSLLNNLGLKPNCWTELTDEILDDAIHLGSFEFQTKGEAKRGEDREVVVLKDDGSETSCRKGIVGDWKNNFSPDIVRRLKGLISEDLIALGYEKDTNW